MNLKLLMAIMACILSREVSGQLAILEDPHITAQQKRMVYADWGNFRPNPKYFLGIQTNIHYTLVWGWLAPSRNRSYRKGSDIRPLAPAGEQTRRMLLSAQMLEISRQKKILADSIQALTRSELYHYSALFSRVDPLWLLYYKKELDPVLEYREQDSRISLSASQLLCLEGTGLLDWYAEQMSGLQQRLEQAFSTDMDRGSRILSYHRVLTEYRQLQSRWDNQLNRAEQLWSLKNKSLDSRYNTFRVHAAGRFTYADQSALMRQILLQSTTNN